MITIREVVSAGPVKRKQIVFESEGESKEEPKTEGFGCGFHFTRKVMGVEKSHE